MLLLFFWHFSYVFMRYKGFCVWEKLKRILKIELFINAMLYHLFFEDNSDCISIKDIFEYKFYFKMYTKLSKTGQIKSMQKQFFEPTKTLSGNILPPDFWPRPLLLAPPDFQTLRHACYELIICFFVALFCRQIEIQ